MEKSKSFNNRDSTSSWSGLPTTDRRYAYSRNSSIKQSQEQHKSTPHHAHIAELKPCLLRNTSSIDIPPAHDFGEGSMSCEANDMVENDLSLYDTVISVIRVGWSGNKLMKRLFVFIVLNIAYTTVELTIGLVTGRVGLISDSFHLTFGCGLLTFSLFCGAVSKRKSDRVYTYGYKRLEVLSSFTNALFLLFMSFSLAVEALHAFIQDESEHKHYLIISAVTNLLVNLIGVWFFRTYARVKIAYTTAEDLNYHSVCLHVLADSIRSAGLILASWLMSLGISNAEVFCLGLVSIAVALLAMPLGKASAGILLQMAPPNLPFSALSKCSRQVATQEDVSEAPQARFWELTPARIVGSICVKVKEGADERGVFRYVHDAYHEMGIHDLTVQIDYH